MLRTIPTVVLAACCLALHIHAVEFPGPDGTILFQVQTNGDGHLVYSVSMDGSIRIGPSPAGIVIEAKDLGAGVTLGVPQKRRLNEAFPWRGNRKSATNDCYAYEVPVTSRGEEWVLEARVFNDGAAFRYRVPGNGTRRVSGESTQWQIPANSTLWFHTDTDDYEGIYHPGKADAVPMEEEVDKKTRPTHLAPPVTVAYADGRFGLISEAALYRYSGLTLRPEGAARFRAAFEDDPGGWSHDGEILSPWRVVILARDLNGLVNSDVIPALCDAPDPKVFPEGINTSWIRPGKGPCTWMVYGNDGAQWDRQKWFVDQCANTGCEYLLVDAGWRSERWGWMKNGGDVWARARELCAYAAQRNVGIILWHSFPEGREDSPGLTTVAAREEFFQNCKRAGVKGVKIDFFNSESKTIIEAYEDLLRRSAQHQVMINFHGANKPTGEARTWPHEITREGIREQEYVLWGELPLVHYGALPFTRMAVGHADFLPGYVQPRLLKNTTPIFQMACVIVFSSPFLCWPENPEAYLETPLLPFIRTVPVTWDETRILPGSKIGETVIMSRRHEADWYVAVLNCRSEPQTLDLDLSALDFSGKELTTWRDAGEGYGYHIETGVKPPTDRKFPVTLRPGGGFMAHLKTPKKFAGW